MLTATTQAFGEGSGLIGNRAQSGSTLRQAESATPSAAGAWRTRQQPEIIAHVWPRDGFHCDPEAPWVSRAEREDHVPRTGVAGTSRAGRRRDQKKGPTRFLASGLVITPGSDLLSHKVTLAVPSAVEGLTSVFGMGTGVTPLL